MMSRSEKKRLLEWQNIIMQGSPDRLIVTEEELLQLSQRQATNELKTIQDCVNVMKTTVMPEKFFATLDSLQINAGQVVDLAPFLDRYMDVTKLLAMNEAFTKEQTYIKEFLRRLPVAPETSSQLAPFLNRMNEENRAYAEKKFRIS